MGPKGQVVIPKRMRDQLGLESGDQVQFWIEGDHLAAARAEPMTTGSSLRGRFADSMLTTDLERDRKEDLTREGSL